MATKITLKDKDNNILYPNTSYKSILDLNEEIHEIEVYADDACTTRPVVGETYTTLYVQLNKSVEYNELIVVLGSGDFDCITVYGAGDLAGGTPLDPYDISLYNNFYSEDFTGMLKKGVYACAASEAITIPTDATLVTSFGDLVTIGIESPEKINQRVEALERELSYIELTDLSAIPITRHLCVANISSDLEFGIESVPSAGMEVHTIIYNSGDSDINIAIPTSGDYVNCGEDDSITLGALSYCEINIVSDGTKVYVRAL